MFDCSADVKAFHDQEVTLPGTEQTSMRDRRNRNRKRLNKNLEGDGKPTPYENVSQGSYQMKTMLRDASNDYDIDDGAYFKKSALVGERGAEMTSLQTRQMVCDAMDDGTLKTPPSVHNNCVRIHYGAGYHVDIPVYRKIVDGDDVYYELASGSGWKRSDARDVTDWYEKERNVTSDAVQFRRINRHLKKHARSRDSWKSRNLSGFGISTLLVEKNVLESDREDRALYKTMEAMRNRLNWNTVINHPVTPNETITSNNPDAKSTYFRDRLTEALDHLAPLFEHDCDREKALKCWDKVFNTTFFSARYEEEQDSESKSTLSIPAIASGSILSSTAAAMSAISETGGGRHA